METRKFGKTGLDVTILGLGAAEIGQLVESQEHCDKFLNGLLDSGINFIDTASCYKDSEDKIGKAVSHRRDDYVLVSKCGHSVDPDDPPEWSGDMVRRSAEKSLKRLRTDHIDVLLLHSCSVDKLTDDMLAALQEVKDKGMTRFIGYSGDGQDAMQALDKNLFEAFETSISVADQQVLDNALPKAAKKNLGVIAKRSIANAAWIKGKHTSGFYARYSEPYRVRLEQMGLTPEKVGFDGSMLEMALRFTVFQPGVSTGIIGGINLEHVKQNIEMVGKGPLDDSVVQNIRKMWKENDDGSWVGLT